MKQSCSPRQDLSNNMWHATSKVIAQVNQGDSWLFVLGSQIVNLIPNPSFGHNLCFKYPNGSWNPILDIYVSRTFQWYKELFNPMSFDPYNHFLKIQESIETPIPKVGAHLGMWGFTFIHFRGHEMWFLGFTLGLHHCKPLPCTFASPYLSCEPKAKVATWRKWFHLKTLDEIIP
jgi:hypothetical protein